MPEPEAELHPAALDILAATPGVLRSMLAGTPDALLSTPGAEGWSPKDVVAHLLSIAPRSSLERVRLMLESDTPPIPNVDEEAILAASGMRSWPLARLLDAFDVERGERTAVLSRLTDEQFRRCGQHSVAGLISVADVINHVAYHDLLHIAQVAHLLAAPIEERRGAMRMF
ncbi:MAG: DinB family protein [Chloroflexota bacterium]|nr:DinB family protein [Chloroflexota bacterium]